MSLVDDHLSVNLFGISGLRDGVYWFRPYNNAGKVFHVAVVRRLINEAVDFLRRRGALSFQMIPATTLLHLASHAGHLPFSKRCALPQNLHVLRDLVSGSRSRWFFDLSESRRFDGDVYLSLRVHLRSGHPILFLTAHLSLRCFCIGRYTSSG